MAKCWIRFRFYYFHYMFNSVILGLQFSTLTSKLRHVLILEIIYLDILHEVFFYAIHHKVY